MLSSGLVEIITDSVSATLHPDKWSEICDRIVHHTGAVNCVIMDYDLEASRGSQLYLSQGLIAATSDMADLISRGKAAEDDAVYEAARKLAPSEIVPEWELLGADSNETMVSNSFRDEVLRRTGAVTRQCMKFNDIGPFVEVGGLHTPYGGRVPDAVAADMSVLIPVIGKSLEMGRIIRRLISTNQTLLDAFDKLDFGAAFVTGAGQVVIGNAYFSELIADGDCLSISGGQIRGAHSADTAALYGTVKSALLPGAQAREHICSLQCRSGRFPMIVKAAPIRENEVGKATLAMLLVIDPADDAHLSAEGLSAFGVLSPAELEVCAQLVRGASTEEISDLRSVTPQTTRHQIKAATSKLACNSRLDLVRLAMASRVPVRPEENRLGRRRPDGLKGSN